MELSQENIQKLFDLAAEVETNLQKVEAIGEDVADSDLSVGIESLRASWDDFKRGVKAMAEEGGVGIGDGEGEVAFVPGCSCSE